MVVLMLYLIGGLILLGIGHNIQGGLIRSLVGELIACTGVWLIITAVVFGVSHYLLLKDKAMDQIVTLCAQMAFASGYISARVFGNMPRKL